MLRFLLLLIVAFCTMGASCTSGSVAVEDTSGQPALIDGDFPEESPCSDRDTLPNDADFLTAITDATEIIQTHKQYTDDDTLPSVCGLSSEDNSLEFTETGWDPSVGDEVRICYTLEDNLSSFFIEGSGESDGDNNPGICRSNFGFESLNTADGFPRAGTYRLDACLNAEAGSYRMRIRVAVSGTDVNKTLAAVPIEAIGDLQVFDPAGTEATTTARAKEVFVDNTSGFTFTIRSAAGADTHLSVNVRVICVKHSNSFCASPTRGCS